MKIKLICNENVIKNHRLHGQIVGIDFSKKTLEIKYFIRTQEEINSFLSGLQNETEAIESLREEFGFLKIFCRFDYGKQEAIEFNVLKEILDFQNAAFDVITIQRVARDFETFERCYDYANQEYENPISMVLDMRDKFTDFMQAIGLIGTWRLSNVRFLYGKFDTHIDNYFRVKRLERTIPFYLVACNKKCNLKSIDDPNCSMIPVPILAQYYFGFDASGFDYRPRSKTHPSYSGKSFAPTMGVFNTTTLLWEERPNDGTYSIQNLVNFTSLDGLVISNENLVNNVTIQRVINYFESLDH